MEAHRRFREIYSWELLVMEAMKASTSTDSGNSHVFPWKLPLPSMGVNLEVYLLPLTSMRISMEVNLLPPTSIEIAMEEK